MVVAFPGAENVTERSPAKLVDPGMANPAPRNLLYYVSSVFFLSEAVALQCAVSAGKRVPRETLRIAASHRSNVITVVKLLEFNYFLE